MAHASPPLHPHASHQSRRAYRCPSARMRQLQPCLYVSETKPTNHANCRRPVARYHADHTPAAPTSRSQRSVAHWPTDVLAFHCSTGDSDLGQSSLIDKRSVLMTVCHRQPGHIYRNVCQTVTRCALPRHRSTQWPVSDLCTLPMLEMTTVGDEAIPCSLACTCV